jgi:hypothetical protein
MTTFVSVPAQAIEDFLKSKGFTRTVQRCEVVYIRNHDRDPNVKIKVYTSIRIGAGSARQRGKDSIKICTVFDDGRRSFGIGKFPRVHRTGSTAAVLERTLERMRAAYARANQWLREQGVQQDLFWKNEVAKREREQEAKAFLAAGP